MSIEHSWMEIPAFYELSGVRYRDYNKKILFCPVCRFIVAHEIPPELYDSFVLPEVDRSCEPSTYRDGLLRAAEVISHKMLGLEDDDVFCALSEAKKAILKEAEGE